MAYQPYPLLSSNSDYGQAINAQGDPVFGEFLSWFSQSAGSSTFFSYSSYLRNALTTGAFVSRFHNAQIRQLDAGMNFFRQQGIYGGGDYTLLNDPVFLNLVSNTSFVLENLNARIRRIDQTLDGVFQSSDLFSATTLTDNYVNNTFWPSTFTYLPALTSDPVVFAEETYVGDANMIYPVKREYVTVEIGAATSSYNGLANEIIFSVTNAGTEFGVKAQGSYAKTTGSAIFTIDGSSFVVFSSNSLFSVPQFAGNFVSTVTFLNQYSSSDFEIL